MMSFIGSPGKYCVSGKNNLVPVRRGDEAARRNDDAPLATDGFDEGPCDFPANY